MEAWDMVPFEKIHLGGDGKWYGVSCSECECSGPDRLSIDEAAQAWNKRMESKDAIQIIQCKDCIFREGAPGQPNIMCGNMKDDDFCSYGERR